MKTANLFKTGAGLVALALIGIIPQTIRAEKIIEIDYRIGKPISNIMNEQVAMRKNKADVVIEKYGNGYTGDAGVGEIIEDAIDIRIGGVHGGSRCMIYDPSGKWIGMNFVGKRYVVPASFIFETNLKNADTNGDHHVSIAEANNYRNKDIKNWDYLYPRCDEDKSKEAPFKLPRIPPRKNNTA
ncbi:hypothetical protein HY449_04305 [Candidatus Pacearchaeota archaeon]|nr:hypothetical protein [Candidatus Pacearchaeota archaeon]